MNLALEINIPPQHILAKSKGGALIEGGLISSEYGNCSKTLTRKKASVVRVSKLYMMAAEYLQEGFKCEKSKAQCIVFKPTFAGLPHSILVRRPTKVPPPLAACM